MFYSKEPLINLFERRALFTTGRRLCLMVIVLKHEAVSACGLGFKLPANFNSRFPLAIPISII